MKTISNNLVKIQGNGHAKCVAQSVYETWNKECYSNIRLITWDCKQTLSETKVLSANKLVLAAASKKFASMLADAEEDVTIIVPGHSFATLKVFLHYIYSGEVMVNNFTPDLQSLLEEWDVCYPDVIPVATTESVRSTILSNQSPSDRLQKSSSSSKKIQNQKSREIQSEIHETSDAQDQNNSHEDESQKKKNNSEISVQQPMFICNENSFKKIARDTGQQAKVNPLTNSVNKRNSRTKSTSATPRSSNYVFLATYMKNSKNKVPGKAVTSTTTSENIAESIAQVVSGYSEEPLTTSPTTNESNRLAKSSGDVNGENGNKTNEKMLTSKEIPDGHQEDNEFVEIDTEEDLRDLGLAVNLLKYEKKRHQELTNSTQDLSGKVQRHRSYLKHFLGFDSVVPQTSDQLGKIFL